VEDEARAIALHEERLIQVPRARAIDGHEGQLGQIVQAGIVHGVRVEVPPRLAHHGLGEVGVQALLGRERVERRADASPMPQDLLDPSIREADEVSHRRIAGEGEGLGLAGPRLGASLGDHLGKA
jgi:hypothetical protein